MAIPGGVVGGEFQALARRAGTKSLVAAYASSIPGMLYGAHRNMYQVSTGHRIARTYYHRPID
eukprot:1555880-Rhodomonas_salina.2